VPKATAVTSTAYYWYNAALVARMAGVLGKADDAKRYAALAESIKEAFNKRFLNAQTGQYDIGTQAAQAFALYFNLAPAEHREKVLGVLVDDILNKHSGHLTSGILGTKYMLNALADAGRSDAAYTIVNQKDFPGWGHMLERGATTLWEHWEFSDNVYSHNHPMFGSVSEWFYKALAGINVADDAVGADKFVLWPNPAGDLTWAQGEYRSIRGRVASKWRVEGDKFFMEVQVPVGATAEVHLPARDAAAVFEGDQHADQAPGVQFLRAAGNTVVYRVGSGTYNFFVKEYGKRRR
jgi:alpha-L-rhamnosidase